MSFSIGNRRGGSRQLSAVAPAALELKPTLKGAWTSQFIYSGFSGIERRNGPSGLAPFVVSMIRAMGDTPSIAELTLYLADPGEVETDASIVTSGDPATVAKLVAGELPTAEVAPDDAEKLASLYAELPQRGSEAAKKFDWRGWFERARAIPVLARPRGFALDPADARSLAELAGVEDEEVVYARTEA